MKKSVKAIGITAALAVMIPLSAYAAATNSGTTGSTGQTNTAVTSTTAKEQHWGQGGFRFAQQDILTLLKLDAKTLKEKLTAGQTLAEIAQAQGVSRDALKQALTDSFNKKLEEQKKMFSDKLDGMIDTKGSAFAGKERGFKAFGLQDLSAAAKVLGLTNAELKTALASDKSLADIAKEKNIDVQIVIDAQKTAITDSINQAVKDGKLTQADADKRLTEAGTIADKIVNGKGFRGGHKHGEQDQQQ
jgi:predicted DNA-binding protein YlxM (UPF0122 family)